MHGVLSMLDLYDGAERWDELIELTRQCRQKGWWRAYGLDDQGYVPLKAEASTVREVTLTYIPGLLQIEHYARELFRASDPRRSAETLDRIVAVRKVRQRRLTSNEDPLELTAIIDESVLHRQVGGGRDAGPAGPAGRGGGAAGGDVAGAAVQRRGVPGDVGLLHAARLR